MTAPVSGGDTRTRDQLADELAHHALSHVNADGWTVCLCGHVAEGDDDDGSHARHQADVLLPAVERIAAERAAEELERAYVELRTTVAKLNPVERLTCFLVKSEDLVHRAAALRVVTETADGAA